MRNTHPFLFPISLFTTIAFILILSSALWAGEASDVELEQESIESTTDSSPRGVTVQTQHEERVFTEESDTSAEEVSSTGGKLISKGWELFNAGQYLEAIQSFTLARSIPEVSLDAAHGLAISYMVEGERTLALPLFEELVQSQYKLADSLPNLLIILVEQKEYEKGLRFAELVTGIEENSEETLLLYRFLQAWGSESVIDDRSFVTEYYNYLQECRNLELFKEVATSLSQAGEATAAADIYRSFLRCSDDPGYRLGLLYAVKPLLPPDELISLSNDEGKRLDTAEDLLKLDIYRRAILYEQLSVEPERVEEIGSAILTIDPKDRVALSALGWSALGKKEYPQAYDYFARVETTDIEVTEHLEGMVYALGGMKKYEQALALIEANSNSPKLAAMKGEIELQVLWSQVAALPDDAPELESLATRIMAITPEDMGIRRIRAWWYFRRGMFDESRQDFSTLYSLDQQEKDHAYGLALVLMKRERFDEVLPIIDENRERDHRLAELEIEIYLIQAKEALEADDTEEAERLVYKVLTIAGENETASEILRSIREEPNPPTEVPSEFFVGIPGHIWLSASRDIKGATGTGGTILLNQGVDWFRLPGDILLNTYAEFRYKSRDKDADYFDETAMDFGLQFKREYIKWGLVYWQEEYPRRDKSLDGTRAFFEWYRNGQKLLTEMKIEALTWATYGRLNHDFGNLTGNSISSFVNLGLDWFHVPYDFVFNTYAEYRISFRSKDNKYHDAHGPVVGMELRRDTLSIGIEHFWEQFPLRDIKSENTANIYLRWYFDWDLKSKDQYQN